MTGQFLTRLTERYETRYPFVAAGMSFAAGPDLAVAVATAGGIGSLGTGYLTPDGLRDAISRVKAKTDKPFHVNFTIFHDDDHLDVCITERVPIVSFHWDIVSAATVERFHSAGIDVWQQAGSAAMAAAAAANGVDVIVAQGSEAGGHNRGGLPLGVLVPEVIAAVPDVTVLAAGGIASGRSVAAALALGADGVWVGTRLVASTEADVHPEWQQRLLAANGADTTLTSVFGPAYPTFNPMRVLRNRVVAEYDARPEAIPAENTSEPQVGELVMDGTRLQLHRFDFFPPTRASHGDFDELPLLAGQGVGQITEILPARAIIETMMRDAVQAIDGVKDAVIRD